MRKYLHFVSLCFCIMFTTALFSQKTVSGNLVDADGQPLIGVNIIVKNTSNGTISDLDGNYEINVNEGDVLVYSYTGFTTQELVVGSESTYDLAMSEGSLLDEVVVVAYGTQRKVTVTGAVSSIQGKEIVKSPAVDISNSLAGRLPGLVVRQTNGEPGQDGALLTIRGTNTLGNSSPLIVIDGIPDRDGGLGRLSSNDIETISVLKDAAAAIYGARAANGAILITTKKGRTGKPTVTYEFNQGWASPTRVPNMSNAVEYANIMNELPIYKSIPQNEWQAASTSLQSTGVYDSPTEGIGSLSANFSPEAVRLHGTGEDPWGYPDTDWFGDAFRSNTPQRKHNLAISGGSDKVTYYASGGYIFQDAIYQNSATNYKQYSLRTNITADVNDYITANLGVMLRREDRNYPTESAGAIFRMLMRGRPTEPEVWPNGLPGPDIENGQNPYVITTNATGYTDIPKDFIQLNGGVDITNPWVEGLTLTLSGAVDKNSQTIKTWQTPWELYYWDRQTIGDDGDPLLVPAVRSNFKDPRLSQSFSTVLNTNLSARINYTKELEGANSLGLMVGVTKEEFAGDFFFAFRRNFISPAIDQLFAGGSTQQNTGGSAYERARLGYYGRAQFNSNDTYLAEFIFRYDGSYIFPESGRWGFFPGILLGYNISNEDWFNVPNLDRLKIRASYGQMGNDQVFFGGQLQEFAYLSTYGFNEYPINSVVESSLEETRLANPDFTWERANNLNIGLDGTVGKVDFSLEYFKNKRDQILIQKTGSTPASSGINSLLPPVNAGKVDNSGYEFNVIYNGAPTSGFRYSAGINGGYAKNKIVFQDEVPGAPDYQLQEGKPIGAYLVYESDGAFLDQAEIEANTLDYSGVTGTLIPGDMKFVDQNGDGIIDGDDQIRLDENIVPTFNFGATLSLQYNNFDLGLLFQGATGSSVRVQTESGDIGNFLKYSHDNRWSIDNPSSEHPRLASRGDTYYTGGNFGNNTYFLFDKDYIRLKNIEIGYNITEGVFEKLGNVRVYLNALNLLTFDKHDIFDPETESQSGVYYPQSKVINAGLSVTF